MSSAVAQPRLGAGLDPMVLAIGHTLGSLAPASVVTGARAIASADAARLHDAERRLIANAVPKRQHEFATGRALLRDLLGSSETIGVGPSRAPAWPAGVRGSLAHDATYAVAAVTTDPRVRALGIDIEPTTRLSADLARAILRPEERHLDAHLVFTLKEAVYKAWSALGGRILDHHDVHVTVQPGRFDARVVDDGARFTGRYVTVLPRTIALVVVMTDGGT